LTLLAFFTYLERGLPSPTGGAAVPTLLVVGGGLFGAQAAALARQRGLEAVVFDAGLEGAASPAAAGLFHERWAGQKLQEHYRKALPVLERLYGIGSVSLTHDDGRRETLLFVPPAAVREPAPVRQLVSAVGDGWLEAAGRVHRGWVYVAAGVWSEAFCAGLGVFGKSGTALVYPGERPGRIRPLGPGRQGIAFVREPGTTYYSDGTAERDFTAEHERQTRQRARELGLTEEPVARLYGRRPYVPGGPVFRQLAGRTWLATGGRKMGTILGAAFARRLVEDELP
jgi:glycine/D-amino acid oxidase-like deaminating enzyme